ncbi:MAG: methionine aminotransferase [Xanthomonadales bacterium]|nr:methionine aminotransferase [Xanthomonadales bacterium]
MTSLHSKLPGVGTTIFTVMSQLAQECGAINLSQGYPDFDPPPGLLDRVEFHLRRGGNQYAPMAGTPALCRAIAGKTQALYGREVDPAEEITVTSGATEALFAAVQAFVGPGQQAIIFDPAYDSYEPSIRLAGGEAVRIPLLAPDFAVDWDRVAHAINDRTALIILNSPHNPTGAVLSAEDLDTLALLLRDTPIKILSDEVYEHIVFDGRTHQSMLRHDELSLRSLVVSSFGKTFHATGWKVGYMVAPPALTAEFRKVHQFCQFCVVSPIQNALADFLQSDPGHYLGLPDFYQQKRDLFRRLMSRTPLQLLPARGTYFQCVDYRGVSDEEDTGFARRLTRELGVAAIPVSVFYQHPPDQRILRFCFAKDDATLERAAAKLAGLEPVSA